MMKIAASLLFVLLLTQYSVECVQVWTTTMDQTKLMVRGADINPACGLSTAANKVTVNSAVYQEMYGFGGALTESSAINFINLKNKNLANYQKVLNNLFDPITGAGFQVLRVPMGSCDFSIAPYFTYSTVAGDHQMKQWSWGRDSMYILPVLKDILAVNPNIKITIAPWSAPTWMKSSANTTYPRQFDSGAVLPQFYDAYANYFETTVQQYKAEGISIYAISMQNEPQNEPAGYPVSRLYWQNEVTISTIIGAKFAAAGITTKIIVFDHNWDSFEYPIWVLNNKDANAVVAGSAFHCYGGAVAGQSAVYRAHPDKEIWFTECSGSGPSNFWGNVEWNTYNLYIGAVQNWARVVLHWNLALDDNAGPKASGGCYNCRGIITVGKDAETVVYNEEYYGMAMFSKFLVLPAYRIDCKLAGGYGCTLNICFKNANGQTVIIVANFCSGPQAIGIQNGKSHLSATAPVGLTTYVW